MEHIYMKDAKAGQTLSLGDDYAPMKVLLMTHVKGYPVRVVAATLKDGHTHTVRTLEFDPDMLVEVR